jgi:hypothetical protein
MLKNTLHVLLLTLLLAGTCSTFSAAYPGPQVPTPTCPPDWQTCPMAAPEMMPTLR